MSFCFYPKHEFACPQLMHCPHLGGAALGAVVHIANTSGDTVDRLYRQLDAARQSVSDLAAENEALKREVERLKLQLKLERQNKFATNRQRQNGVAEDKTPESPSDAQPRKRAPRWAIPAGSAPRRPNTTRSSKSRPRRIVRTAVGRSVSTHRRIRPIIFRRTSSRGAATSPCSAILEARCRSCRRWVQKAGEGEILGSMIGPRLRAIAVYLHNDIGISLRKVPRGSRTCSSFASRPRP